MRYLLSLLALLFFTTAANAQQSAGVSPAQTFACNQTAVYDTNTNGATQLVAPASNTKGVAERVYICGYTIWAAGTVSVSLEYGTKVSTDCDTGAHKITPTYALTTQTGIQDNSPFFKGLAVPFTSPTTPQQLCILTNAGVAVAAIVYYSLF